MDHTYEVGLLLQQYLNAHKKCFREQLVPLATTHEAPSKEARLANGIIEGQEPCESRKELADICIVTLNTFLILTHP